jgi:hypothetical protein
MCSTPGGSPAMSKLRAFLCIVCLCAVFGETARAELITSNYLPYPNLEVAGMSGTYTASTGHFFAIGYPSSYSVVSWTQQDLMPSDYFNWVFRIDAYLDLSSPLDPLSSTPIVAAGTVTIQGSSTGPGGVATTLLTGTIEAFGESIAPSLNPATTLFQFSFHVTDGVYAADFGSTALIILSPGFVTDWGPGLNDTPYVGDLSQDFTFTGPSGVVDVVTIPEPNLGVLALMLMVSGLVMYCSRRRGTRRRA